MNPLNITNFNRTQAELEEFWLFCLFTAGKNADVAARKTSEFLSERGLLTPFDYLRTVDIRALLEYHKIGQYNRMERALKESMSLDLANDSLTRLNQIYGAGMKTCRFFLLHSRKDCKCAVLDTHILKWLNALGVNCGTQTPTAPKEYDRLEEAFLTLASIHHPQLSIAELDLALWATISGRMEAINQPALA